MDAIVRAQVDSIVNRGSGQCDTVLAGKIDATRMPSPPGVSFPCRGVGAFVPNFQASFLSMEKANRRVRRTIAVAVGGNHQTSIFEPSAPRGTGNSHGPSGISSDEGQVTEITAPLLWLLSGYAKTFQQEWVLQQWWSLWPRSNTQVAITDVDRVSRKRLVCQ
jgi:hypothetical protein